ncbi:hypothetical protein NKH53_25555 [Mesorhizobium australicum]|uniref:hypothetical protein n=1 Tax=Mesorhizobium australicum TaxID=536018 RepID=UPI00333AF051
MKNGLTMTEGMSCSGTVAGRRPHPSAGCFDASQYRRGGVRAAGRDALDSIAAGMKISKPDLIQIVLSDWLETNAYLPLHELDDDKPDRRAWLTLIQRVAPMKPLKY